MAWLARGDYSQIEARVNPWLAGAEWKLDAFRAYDAGTGPDLYKVAAGKILGIEPAAVSKAQRQAYGKVSELALGFQGGANALQNMAKAYGTKIPRWPRDEKGLPVDPRSRPDLKFEGTDEWIKRGWRASNPEIVGLWEGLEHAAVECMSRPMGEVVEVWTLRKTWVDGQPQFERMHKTPLTFRRNSQALALRMPAGGSLLYWTPRLALRETPFGKKWTLTYRAEDPVTKRWREFTAYGGLFTENAVQKVARDIMRDALLRMYRGGILPVLTVHDEGVAEIPHHLAATAADAAAIVQRAMAVPVEWAPGLPIAADSSAHARYVKGD